MHLVGSAGAALLFGVSTSLACLCAPVFWIGDHYEAAGTVVIAEFKRTERERMSTRPERDADWATMRVERSYKGGLKVGDEIRIYQGTRDSCSVQLNPKIRERYLLFLTEYDSENLGSPRSDGHKAYLTSPCAPSGSLKEAGRDVRLVEDFAAARRTLRIGDVEFQTEVRTLKNFEPGSTSLTVLNGSRTAVPTFFSFEPPKRKRLQASREFEGAKKEWLKRHPRSQVAEIQHSTYTYNGMPTSGRNAYVWVMDGDAIFNIELVRRGICDARAMLLEPEEELGILISYEAYQEFTSRAVAAEALARSDKVGIWASDRR
jgi:hypothetical protein